MENLTVVIPFWHGHATLPALLNSIPPFIPVIVVNDYESEQPDVSKWSNARVIDQERRGYFSGGCNLGFDSCDTDVLILNQDGELRHGWQRALQGRDAYGVIGDGVMGHPAWPNGYIQGTFMYIRRDVLNSVGGFNAELYPLWGSTCEFQLRACRAGFKARPINIDGHFEHKRKRSPYGDSIRRTLEEQPEDRRWLINTPPEVSVIITVYNYGRYLEQAVRSVLDQTLQSTEIIIVDDGSTDNTRAVGERLADPWKGIRYIYQRNQGASVAANTGIRMARGRYVTVLDGDDWYAPTRLEVLRRAAEANPHSVIYDDVMYCTDTGQRHKVTRGYDFEELLERNMMHKGILYPRKAWQQVGGYSPTMDDGREDWEFNIRLGLAGYCGVHVSEPLYMYRRQNQGRTQRLRLQRNYFRKKIVQLHPDVYLKGARPMACCGRGRTSKPRTTSIRTTSGDEILTVQGLGTAPGTDWTAMEYTGSSIGNQTIWGPSGERYKYGKNGRNLRFWARNEDVEFLLSVLPLQFKMFTAPKPAPKPVPAPTAPAEPDQILAEEVAEVDEVVPSEPETREDDLLALGLTQEQVDQAAELGLHSYTSFANADVEQIIEIKGAGPVTAQRVQAKAKELIDAANS